MQAAQTELDGIATRISPLYPSDYKGIQFKLAALQDEVVGNAKSGLLLLLGSVSFLLLIACTNVSNLVLSRGVQRQNEIAVRIALGANRGRILYQLLIESLLLSGLGGAAGMLLAIYGINAYRSLANVPRISELHVDFTIAWAALALASLAGIICGLAPALHTSRPDLNLALKERLSSGAAGAGKLFSLRSTLVVIEVALALVLLNGSALMIQSMVRMLSVNTGFRTENLLTAELTLPESHYATPEARILFIQKLLSSLHDNDHFKNTVLSDSLTLNDRLTMMRVDGSALGIAEQSATLQERSVSSGYFETLGIRIISGRAFDEKDTKGATPVAVINEAMMRKYFSGKPPLGKILKFGPDYQCQIIGVAADTRDVRKFIFPNCKTPALPFISSPPAALIQCCWRLSCRKSSGALIKTSLSVTCRA
jgi:putative ABC transport system permease protein